MFEIRQATVDDRDQVVAMVTEREQWMRERGMSGSGNAGAAIGEQIGDPAFPAWVLLRDGVVVGSTTVFTESPAWCFTDEERTEPAVFLASTFTAPTPGHRLGRLIAYWSLDYAFRTGRKWVRRSTFEEPLMRYYRDAQGWSLIREVERRGRTSYAMTRTAEPRPDLATLFANC